MEWFLLQQWLRDKTKQQMNSSVLVNELGPMELETRASS